MEEVNNNETFDKPKIRTVSYSEIVLLGIVFVIGVIAWLLFQNLLLIVMNGGTFGGTGGYSILYLTLMVLLFFLYFSFLSIFLIFSSKRVAIFGSIFIAIVPLILFIGLINSIIAILTSIAFYFVLISARYSMNRAYLNQIKFFLPGVLRIGLALLLLYTTAMISLFHYSVITQKDDAADSIGRSVVRYSVVGLNTFMRQFDGYDPQMSLDSFILFAGSQGLVQTGSDPIDPSILEKLGAIVDAEALSGEQLINQQKIIRTEFIKSLGLSNKGIIGTTPITDIWKIYIESKSISYLDTYKNFLPAIVSLSIFLTLLFLNKAFKPIIYFFTWIIIRILRLANILMRKDETITIKRLMY